MSLINQMLRDLEQRNSGQSAAPLALDIQPASPQNASRKHWPWLLVAMLASVFYAWNSRQQSPSAPWSAADVAIAPPQIAMKQPMALPTQAPQAKPEPETLAISPAPTAIPQPTATPSAIPLSAPFGGKPPANKAGKPQQSTAIEPRRTPSTKRQLQALLQQAQGNVSLLMRKETLKEALLLEPDNLAVRDQLLQTLLKSGNGVEVEGFLQESLRLFPNHLTFITSLAQLHLQRKDYAAATAILERVDSSEAAYLALLAASYQQQKRFHHAAELYQRLTQMQPDKAENWLGLAISSDNLHRGQDAAQAYRQALDKNTLNADVVDYIKQRLSALN